MIHEEKCYVGECNNCGKILESFQGYSLFPLSSDVNNIMMECDWYIGDSDSEHPNKHYCPHCYKHDEDVDDKIIVDLTRKKQ